MHSNLSNDNGGWLNLLAYLLQQAIQQIAILFLDHSGCSTKHSRLSLVLDHNTKSEARVFESHDHLGEA
jgi:hypothetical protein